MSSNSNRPCESVSFPSSCASCAPSSAPSSAFALDGFARLRRRRRRRAPSRTSSSPRAISTARRARARDSTRARVNYPNPPSSRARRRSRRSARARVRRRLDVDARSSSSIEVVDVCHPSTQSRFNMFFNPPVVLVPQSNSATFTATCSFQVCATNSTVCRLAYVTRAQS